MKNLVTIIFCFFSVFVWSQVDTTSVKYSKIVKHDGSEFIGIILKDDEREILLNTESIGNVVIPKHEIKKIEPIDYVAVNEDGSVWSRNLLASRYTITTNGFPVKKGEGYLRIMPVGIDFQFPITDRWSIGGMTSWYGVPIVLTSKISTSLSDGMHVSGGFLCGNLMHGASFSGDPFLSYGGGIGFGNVSFGNEERNLNLSCGYGFVHFPQSTYNEYQFVYERSVISYGTTMFSIGGMARVTDQFMLVFDSMGLFANTSFIYWINPSVRYMPKPDNIWQFGINMAGYEDLFIPVPIPSISFTRVFAK